MAVNAAAKVRAIALVVGLIWCQTLFAQSQEKILRDREVTLHVANRLGYGATPEQLLEIKKIGWEKWLDEQLNPAGIDDSALEQRLARDCPSTRMSLAEIADRYALRGRQADSPESEKKLDRERNELRNTLKRELQDSLLLRATYSKRQFQEVIVNFWRNHFSVDINKVPYLATHYEENVIRKYAFGRFEDLLLATARHPAMLVFLDNYVSTKNGLNENYARELMELHTLGVDNFYKQKDVIELARILTGWSYQEATPEFVFNQYAHDDRPATLLDLQLDGLGGMADGEKAIRHLAQHPGTSRFLAQKLCRYLVNDVPAPELVEHVTLAFRSCDGDLPTIYREIINSADFMSKKNFRAKFKTPFEFTVSALRTTGASVESWDDVVNEIKLMGQPLYECNEPTGYGDQAEAWLDPGVMVYRWNFSIKLMQGKVKGVTVPESLVASLMTVPPNARVKEVMNMFLPVVNDPQLTQTLARAGEPKLMIALVLGSASFQQQ